MKKQISKLDIIEPIHEEEEYMVSLFFFFLDDVVTGFFLDDVVTGFSFGQFGDWFFS